MKEPDWLEWARELQAIAQTGLTFCRDPYDRERYEAIRQLAARMFAARTDAPLERIDALFAGETGYANRALPLLRLRKQCARKRPKALRGRP